jgi:class 3 adenylate cyclase
VRIGVNAGEPISTEGRLFARRRRVQDLRAAGPGQILVSDVVSEPGGKGLR